MVENIFGIKTNIISKDTTKKMINFVLNGEGHKAAELLNLGETPINETL